MKNEFKIKEEKLLEEIVNFFNLTIEPQLIKVDNNEISSLVDREKILNDFIKFIKEKCRERFDNDLKIKKCLSKRKPVKIA